MNLDQALAMLPPDSPYRDILPDLFDPVEDIRDMALEELRQLEMPANQEEAHATTWEHSEKESLALLALAVTMPFPPPKFDWNDAVHELIFSLVRSPYPSLVALARKAYSRLSDRAKCAVLSLYGAAGTREAAEAFVNSIRENGWPAGVYSRVFTELRKLLEHGDVLFPSLVELAGTQIGAVTDVLLAFISQTNPDRTLREANLESIAPLAAKQLSKTLKTVAKMQRPEGVAWRFSEEYFY